MIHMIRPNRVILTAALSLIMSALTVHTTQAQAVRTQTAPLARITTSEDITVPGNYILANDVAGTGGAGIEIDASNVKLNLNGHTVSGGDGIGIEGENVHVYNGRVVGSNVGVLIIGSYCLVHDLNITASGFPVFIEFGNSNRVRNCVLSAVATY
jgi:hypothetical protein